MKTLFKLLSAVVFGLICGLFGWQFGRSCAVNPQIIKEPLSIGETQQILKDLGYYQGKVDYKWGRETDKAYCQYMAEKSSR